MDTIDVNGEERRSHVLAVRLTAKEQRRLRRTLRNFEIRGGSASEQLRALFRKVHQISLNQRRRREEIQRYVEGRREREALMGEEE